MTFYVVSNKGIAEGIKANTTTVVDDVVDVLPNADALDKKVLLISDLSFPNVFIGNPDALDKKVLLISDNKIYQSVKEKVINPEIIIC